MPILLHVCCAPCLSKSLAGWRRELGLPADGAGKKPPPPPRGRGWFFNPNIHPFKEFFRRRKALAVYAERDPFPVDLESDYGLDAFMDDLAGEFSMPSPEGTNATHGASGETGQASEFATVLGGKAGRRWRRPERCARCMARRLDATARRAKTEGYEAFATTLAASREQDRDLVEAAGCWSARRWGVPFVWRDWREEEPPERLVKGIYRQAWCGCVFSERDRYARETQDGDTNFAGPPPIP